MTLPASTLLQKMLSIRVQPTPDGKLNLSHHTVMKYYDSNLRYFSLEYAYRVVDQLFVILECIFRVNYWNVPRHGVAKDVTKVHDGLNKEKIFWKRFILWTLVVPELPRLDGLKSHWRRLLYCNKTLIGGVYCTAIKLSLAASTVLQ